jgi:hypothetical protein
MNSVQRGKYSIKAVVGCGNLREKQDYICSPVNDRGPYTGGYTKYGLNFFVFFEKSIDKKMTTT